jgi:hypothetical protein
MAGPWDKYAQPPGIQIKPRDPKLPGQVQGQNLSNAQAGVNLEVDQATKDAQIREALARAAVTEGAIGDRRYDNTLKLRSDFDALPETKFYRVGVSQLATALKTADNPTGDNALIYAYAKAMDPASVVRESEMGMAAAGQSAIESAVVRFKKEFGMEGEGQLSPKVRTRLRNEIANKVTQLNRVYSAQRNRFIADASAFGIDPDRVVGKHDGDAFAGVVKEFADKVRPQQLEAATAPGATPLGEGEVMRDGQRFYRDPQTGEEEPVLVGGSAGAPSAPGYLQSPLSQGLSGVNEGIADVAGLPVDLVTGTLNLGVRGVNSLANTDLSTIQNPILGSDWIKARLTEIGSIGEQPTDTGGQISRRIGRSVGASTIPAGTAGSLTRAGGQLLAGVGSGIGGAGAQQAFPGNPYAEMAGEILGGGTAALGMASRARTARAREVEAAVPTTPQLRERTNELYRRAEQRGVTAQPETTSLLQETTRQILTDEGLISPTGRVSEAHPKVTQALRLIDDYAGQPMQPREMNTVRKIIGEARTSGDASERRLANLLTENFDDWASPLAPEFAEARNVARRYLVGEQLEQSRELAGARASQFSGSGFENALRTEYRGLDRDAIKGRANFPPDVQRAVETVSRGTPASNFARGLGRLAPTGIVSGALGTGTAAGLGMMSGLDPSMAGALGLGVAGLGIGGRTAATRMGLRNADIAELTARNGGALPETQLLPPEFLTELRRGSAAQGAKYLPEYDETGAYGNPYGNPNPLPRREGKRPLLSPRK